MTGPMNKKKDMRRIGLSFFILLGVMATSIRSSAQEKLIKYPGQWQFEIGKSKIRLTSDQQLRDLQDPDKEIELTRGFGPEFGTLREMCELARENGYHILTPIFDHFWAQYRQESNPKRNLTPDSDEYIRYMKGVSDFAGRYGLGLELSLLSPLEIGKAYAKSTGESGRWVQYLTDIRDPETGQFSAMIWEHLAWSNNKGKVRPVRTGIKAYAYQSRFSNRQGYRVVHPEDIREISAEIRTEVLPGTRFPETQSFEAQRLRIFCEGDAQWKGYNRVLVLVSYDVPEMDYFSPNALPFLKSLMEKYYDAGINLQALYSDEMHIQQDWSYHAHHDRGQFDIRYLTENFARAYAEAYGQEYADMDKMMLYFAYGPEIYSNTVTAAEKNIQFVMGDSPEAVQRTALMRDRYYKMLNAQVVDLFLAARRYAESLYGRELPTRAHATWAQSPTIDFTDVGPGVNMRRFNYEYTPNFVWSNTVHQASSACYDYFKWGEYLTGMGTDHTEGGMGDRNYYAAALASSFGLVNEYPNAYNGAWGFPDGIRESLTAVFSAYGAFNAFTTTAQMTERVHRDVDVLMLYPMNLVASEERFGSWMTQYGYANYLTAEKLLELGQVTDDGRILIKGRDFTTVAALLETFPDPDLLEMLEQFARLGGNLVWSGPPPIINNEGEPCLRQWKDLFGVEYQPETYQGKIAPGRMVTFLNRFRHIPSQTILTDFLPDHTYPVQPAGGTETVAQVDEDVVGTLRSLGKGRACFLGFRPRDDQSQSLGYEQRTWFEILDALGAYPGTGTFGDVNDNTEHLSRTTDYLCTRFPNHTTAIARHYRTHAENWSGGFGRDREADLEALQENPLPDSRVILDGFRVNGHEISYEGDLLVAFRLDGDQDLMAFDGRDCSEITIGGRTHVFADRKIDHIAWTPVPAIRQIADEAFFQVYFEGEGKVSIPMKTGRKDLALVTEGILPGTIGESIPFLYRKGNIELELNDQNTGRWLYLTGKE
jgi:hypothetical protein